MKGESESSLAEAAEPLKNFVFNPMLENQRFIFSREQQDH
jgi:hypothetical protein